MRDVAQFSNCGSGKFREIVSCFLLQPGLPFADILSAERIERIFKKHRNLFGGEIYSVAVMVWSFLIQANKGARNQIWICSTSGRDYTTGGLPKWCLATAFPDRC